MALSSKLRETLRMPLGEAVAFVRSKETVAGIAGTTLQTALVEAIYELDSTQVDPIANLDAGSPQYEENLNRARFGQLQRIQKLKTLLLGDGTEDNVGVFALAELALAKEQP